jgi:hypothetical protein
MGLDAEPGIACDASGRQATDRLDYYWQLKEYHA